MKTYRYITRLVPIIILTILALQTQLPAQEGSGITLVGQWAEGPCYTALLHGEVAVMNNGAYMVLVDISDPTHPVELSRLLTPSFINSITVVDNIAYVASEDIGLRTIDISDPVHPAELGVLAIPGFDAEVVYHNGYIFHTSNSETPLRIIDVSDPASPVEAQSVNLSPRSRVAFYGDYMYVASREDGFLVYSIADIENPDSIGRISSMYYCAGVTIDNNFAYVNGRDSLFWGERVVIYDLSDPENPSVASVAYYGIFSRISSCQVENGYVFIGDHNGITIKDVSDPYSPVSCSGFINKSTVIDVFVSDSLVILASDNDGIVLVNISDIKNPEFAGNYDSAGNTYGIAVQGDFAYLANGWDGLRILDISDPANPVAVSDFATPQETFNVKVVDHYAFVANYAVGLRILDISDPTDPVEVSRIEDCCLVEKVKIEGSTAFIPDGRGFVMIDISDPVHPGTCNLFQTEEPVNDLAVQGDIVFLAGDQGFRIVDISDPDHPVERSHIDEIGSIQSIAVKGDFAYVGLPGSYGRVIDFSNLAHPVFVNQVITAQAYSLTIVDDLLYVSAGEDGVYIFDITNPLKLVELGYYNTGGEVYDIDPVGDYVYMADLNTGLTIVRFDALSSTHQALKFSDQDLSIERCFPNPFSDNLSITYQTKAAGATSISVYDATGQLVRMLMHANVVPGQYTVNWDGCDQSGNRAAAGMYFLELKKGNTRDLKPVVLMY